MEKRERLLPALLGELQTLQAFNGLLECHIKRAQGAAGKLYSRALLLPVASCAVYAAVLRMKAVALVFNKFLATAVTACKARAVADNRIKADKKENEYGDWRVLIF